MRVSPLQKMSLVGLGLMVCTAAVWADPAAVPSLPPPIRLAVEYLPTPSHGIGTLLPRFDFVATPPTATERNLTLAAVQIVCVTAETGAVVWDSGMVPSNVTTGLYYGNLGTGAGGKTGVNTSASSGGGPGATPLLAGRRYTWTAAWMAEDGRVSPPSAPASFDVALLAAEDWAGATWLGGGQREFRTTIDLTHLSPGAVALVGTVHVSSPGGVLVSVNGQLAGDDQVGLSESIASVGEG